MSTIAVNPPKTPVTEGSGGKAPATTPNVCKMPGPPAPFVPTPLPNLGTSGDHLNDGTTTVKFEGKKVAIKGSYFMSQPSGDVVSQGTGGGLISSNTQGKTEWLAPGSMDVKAEGKNIQLLGDAMSNNGRNPTNAASMKELQDAIGPDIATELCEHVCNNYKQGKGRGQGGDTSKDFIDEQSKKGNTDWTRENERFDLKGNAKWKQEFDRYQKRLGRSPKTVMGSCIPDLYNSKTGKMVELKGVKEGFTPQQRQFRKELAKGKHSRNGRRLRKRDHIVVTPISCGCEDGA